MSHKLTNSSILQCLSLALAFSCFALLAPAQIAEDPIGEPPTDEIGEVPAFGTPIPEDVEDAPEFTVGSESEEEEAEAQLGGGAWGREPRGLYVLAASDGLQTIRQAQNLSEDFASAGFTRLYPETRTVSGVAYQSRLENSLPMISQAWPNPVAELAALLGNNGEVHAVFSVLPAYNATLGSRPPSNNPAGRYPFIVNRTIDGEIIAADNLIHLDPGAPETRDYLASVLTEMDASVRPTGFLFRDLSYPGRRWGYSSSAVAAFRREVGGQGNPSPDDPVWSAWRREQLTRTLVQLRSTMNRVHPDAILAVMVSVSGEPPRDWTQWQRSELYSEQMVDWVTWCKQGLIDEIVLEVHEEAAPQGNVLKQWVTFLNSNSYDARPLVSIAGSMNFTQGLVLQYGLVRSRGVGTILHHYARPARDTAPGFFASLPNVLFRGRAGRPLRRPAISGPEEVRQFVVMDSPPAQVLPPTRTPREVVNPLQGRELVFETPTPIPTPTPVPFFVPDPRMRIITLRSGVEVEARVLRVNAETITIQTAGAPPVELKRNTIEKIDPPL